MTVTMDIDAGESEDQSQGKSTHTANPNVNVVKATEFRRNWNNVNMPAAQSNVVRATQWKVPMPATQSMCFLPPLEDEKKKTLVLDLDGTLISGSQNSGSGHDFTITFPHTAAPGGGPTSFYVSKRPGAEDLLQQLAGLYEIVVFTFSRKKYADAIVDELLAKFDPEHRVIPATHRLYREHCRRIKVTPVPIKDLSFLGRDLKNVIFVDDFPLSYSLQPRNAIPVKPWSPTASDDKSLFKILSFCKQIVNSSADVRDLIDDYLHGKYD